MKKIFLLLSLFVFLFSCEEYDNGVENSTLNYGFTRTSEVLEVDDTSPVMKVKLFRSVGINEATTVQLAINTAPPAGVSANNYDVDDFTFNTSVSFPAGATEAYLTLNFDPTKLVLGEEKIVNIKVASATGATPVTNVSALNTNLKYKLLCKFNTVKLDIKQDRYGSETTWAIKDASNNTVASGGPYADLASNTTLQLPTRSLCLQNGTYTLWFYDLYGDGMVTSATVYGSYTLKKADGTVLVSALGNAFTTSASHSFSL